MQELNDDLQAAQQSAKAARGQESSLKQEVNRLNQELQKSQRLQRRLQSEKEAQEKDIQELQKQIKRLRGALQVSQHCVATLWRSTVFLFYGTLKSSQRQVLDRSSFVTSGLEMSRERSVLLPVVRQQKLQRQLHKRLLSASRAAGRQVGTQQVVRQTFQAFSLADN